MCEIGLFVVDCCVLENVLEDVVENVGEDVGEDVVERGCVVNSVVVDSLPACFVFFGGGGGGLYVCV